MQDMERFNRMAIGREKRIIELKRQINEMLKAQGQEVRYRSPELLDDDSLLD